jgi:uncharacterized protein (TIGR02996 family)
LVTILVTIAALLAVPVGIVVVSYLPKRPHELFLEHWQSPAGQAEYRRLVFAAERAMKDPMPPAWAASLSADEIEKLLLDPLRARPADEELRMIYADWLEQSGDDARAAYVRGYVAGLLDHTDLEWRAVTSHAVIPHHACGELRWSELAIVVGDAYVRDCPRCNRRVRFCQSVEVFENQRAARELGVLDPARDVVARYLAT